MGLGFRASGFSFRIGLWVASCCPESLGLGFGSYSGLWLSRLWSLFGYTKY